MSATGISRSALGGSGIAVAASSVWVVGADLGRWVVRSPNSASRPRPRRRGDGVLSALMGVVFHDRWAAEALIPVESVHAPLPCTLAHRRKQHHRGLSAFRSSVLRRA